MTKNKFGNRFSSDDFLAAIPEQQLITSAGIMKRVGCSSTTTTTYMERLVEQGLVRRVEIIGGRDVVWQKVV